MGELFPKPVRSQGGRTSSQQNGDAKRSYRFPEPPFSLEESMVMRVVDVEGVSLDTIVEKTKLSAAKVNSLCMNLRMKGMLRFFPGNRVALPREP